MKKIFSIAIAALALTACSEMYGPKDDPVPTTPGKSVKITVDELKDSSFTITFAPEGEVAYYSYLVDQDSKVYELDADALYGVEYTSVDQATIKYTAENPSKKIKFSNLEPDTDYVIYAVAGSLDGTVGEITTRTLHTPDGVLPEITDASCSGRVLTLEFSENVEYTDSAIVAKYYASNYYAKSYLPFVDDSQMMGKIEGTVEVSGNVATVTFEGLPDGAYYAPIVPDGAFIDSVGQVADGFDNGMTYVADSSAFYPTGPVYGHVAASHIACTVDELPVILDYNKYVYVTFDNKWYISGAVANKVVVKVVHKDGSVTETKETTLSGAPYYGALGAYAFGYKLPYEPERGDYVTVTIPEKTFYDVFGNYNAEIVVGPLVYSYGLTIDDVIGEYSYTARSMFYGTESTLGLTIAESDDPE